MQRIYTIFAVLLLLPGIVWAQASISGQVVDASTGDPLPGANVILKDTNYGTSTDAEGRFTLANIPPGSYVLQVRFVGYDPYETPVRVGERPVTLYIELEPTVYVGQEIAVLADRAIERKTPLAFTTVKQVEMERLLGSRDLPLVLNVTPGVYATQQGGGAGDARINIRGFDQRNVAVMINGVPVNDMENGWVYWSNWDGLADVTSSIQVQRGLGASNLAVPSVGGTMNILTSPSAQKLGAFLKQEVGSGNFLKTTFTANTGLINKKFAASFAIVRKTGNGIVDQTWTDAWAYYAAVSYQIHKNHRLELYAVGAPQRHGQRLYKQSIATFDKEYAAKLGIDVSNAKNYGILYNPNWGPVLNIPKEAIKEYWNDKVRDPRDPGVLMERENYYHKPQVNLNWYWQASDRLFISNVFYFSRGKGGGTGPKGRLPRYASGEYAGLINWDQVYQNNTSTTAAEANPDLVDQGILSPSETRAFAVIRNSVNRHYWVGWIGKAEYELTPQVTVQTGIDARYYKGEHWREVRNLIGGDYYLDYDDDNQPHPVKRLGDRIDYYNDGLVRWLGGFVQAEGEFDDLTAFVSTAVSTVGYNRIDYFLPKVDGKPAETGWTNLRGFALKGGLNYNINERLNVYANAGYLSRPPFFRAVYDYNNNRYDPLINEKIQALEFGGGYRDSHAAVNINLYNTWWKDRSWFTSVRSGDIVYNFMLRGINALHRGIEFEFRLRPFQFLDLYYNLSLGDWTWTNDVVTTFAPENDPTAIDTFEVYAKGLKVGDAPQKSTAFVLTLHPVRNGFVTVSSTYFWDHYAAFDPARRNDPNDREQAWRVPNYFQVDLHAGYSIAMDQLLRGSRLQLGVHVFNLLDERFITDATDGPYHNAASARVFFGLPRNFNAYARITF